MNRTQMEPWAGQARIRPASGEDRAALAAFLAGLSPRTSYLRFFMGGSPAGPALLAVFTGARPGVDAVVATRAGMVIGHAMAACVPGPGAGLAADLGVVVADSWQGRGVGSALVRAVVQRARARGATTLTMDVLAENRHALAMISAHWPGVPRVASGPYLAVHAPLPPPPPGGPVPAPPLPRPRAAPRPVTQ